MRFGDQFVSFEERELRLDWQRIATRRAIPDSMRVNARVDVLPLVFDQMVIELTAYVLVRQPQLVI